VLTDEELIERLHEGLSHLTPRGDPLDELRRQAAADTSRPLRRRILRRAPRRLGTAIGVAAAPLVAVIIGAAALALLHHHAATRPSPAATRPAGRDLKSLERAFPFLRRPQTAADRASLPGLERFATAVPGIPRVTVQATLGPIPQLTRLVTSQDVTVRVFVARVEPTRVIPASAATTARVRRLRHRSRPTSCSGRQQAKDQARTCSTRSTTRS